MAKLVVRMVHFPPVTAGIWQVHEQELHKSIRSRNKKRKAKGQLPQLPKARAVNECRIGMLVFGQDSIQSFVSEFERTGSIEWRVHVASLPADATSVPKLPINTWRLYLPTASQMEACGVRQFGKERVEQEMKVVRHRCQKEPGVLPLKHLLQSPHATVSTHLAFLKPLPVKTVVEDKKTCS